MVGEVCGYTGEAFAVFCRTSTATEVGATIEVVGECVLPGAGSDDSY
jgi:hypothetical protein